MFRIYLQVNDQPRGDDSEGAYARVDDSSSVSDILTVLDTLCQALDSTGRVSFWAEGFGQRPWPVDVATDLSVCLSELPELAGWLRGGGTGPCEWWFFEQGLERKLVLNTLGEVIEVRCVSFGAWQPDPDVEVVPHGLLRAMLGDLVRVFHEQARILCPNLVAHQSFHQWLQSVELTLSD